MRKQAQSSEQGQASKSSFRCASPQVVITEWLRLCRRPLYCCLLLVACCLLFIISCLRVALGALETWRPGDLEAWRPGDLETWSLGDLETWRPGDLETNISIITQTWN